ncbi:MAG: DUF523 domain-containing protein, partial [Planctomycetota bacterium]|nr:DUF523 domain-containing protein [Planctomycetota bacterium]
MEPVLVSACLYGRACRYDGTDCLDEVLLDELEAAGRVPVPFCPEEAGELPTPRPAAWIAPGGDEKGPGDAAQVLSGQARVVTGSGDDVSAAFLAGAREALLACQELGTRRAYLKERSPSCGVKQTHVGGQAVAGMGVTARLLADNGVTVVGVEGGRRAAEAESREAPEPEPPQPPG